MFSKSVKLFLSVIVGIFGIICIIGSGSMPRTPLKSSQFMEKERIGLLEIHGLRDPEKGINHPDSYTDLTPIIDSAFYQGDLDFILSNKFGSIDRYGIAKKKCIKMLQNSIDKSRTEILTIEIDRPITYEVHPNGETGLGTYGPPDKDDIKKYFSKIMKKNNLSKLLVIDFSHMGVYASNVSTISGLKWSHYYLITIRYYLINSEDNSIIAWDTPLLRKKEFPSLKMVKKEALESYFIESIDLFNKHLLEIITGKTS